MLGTNTDLAFWGKYECAQCARKTWTLQPLSLEITSKEDHQTRFFSTQATRGNWWEGWENDESHINKIHDDVLWSRKKRDLAACITGENQQGRPPDGVPQHPSHQRELMGRAGGGCGEIVRSCVWWSWRQSWCENAFMVQCTTKQFSHQRQKQKDMW